MDVKLMVQLFLYLMLFIFLKVAYDKLWDPDDEIEKEIKKL